MYRSGLLAMALAAVATPGLAADLGGEIYEERSVIIERPAPPPPVVVRERVIERHYYSEPAYRERRVYIAPPIHDEPIVVVPRRHRAHWRHARRFHSHGPHW